MHPLKPGSRMGTTKDLGVDSVLQELSELALRLCKNKASGGPLSWRKEANRVSFMAKVWSNPRYVVVQQRLEKYALGAKDPTRTKGI